MEKGGGERFFGLWDGIAVLVMTILLGALLVGGIEKGRLDAKRGIREWRLHRIANALCEYHESFGTLPPAWTEDRGGRPLQSWRVLILPFLGLEELYEQIRLEEPWDSDWNRQFHSDPRIRGIYSSPFPPRKRFFCRKWEKEEGRGNYWKDSHSGEPTLSFPEWTTYSVVVGPKTLFPGKKSIRWDQVTDGLSTTVLVIERPDPVGWMEPDREIRLEEAILYFPDGEDSQGEGITRPKRGESERDGVFIAMAEGSVRFIPSSISPDVWRFLLSRKDREGKTP